MTVGDRWVTATESKADGEEATETVTEVVTAVEKKGGAIIVSVAREVDGKLASAVSQVKVTDQGLFRMSTQQTVFDVPYHVLKLPLKAGEAWTTEARAGGGAGTTFRYKVMKEEDVEVPAGKFKAFRIDVESDGQGRTSRASLWYAPRVGVVRQEHEGGNQKYVKVLKSFKPGK
jgi:hypothetical protein